MMIYSCYPLPRYTSETIIRYSPSLQLNMTDYSSHLHMTCSMPTNASLSQRPHMLKQYQGIVHYRLFTLPSSPYTPSRARRRAEHPKSTPQRFALLLICTLLQQDKQAGILGSGFAAQLPR